MHGPSDGGQGLPGSRQPFLKGLLSLSFRVFAARCHHSDTATADQENESSFSRVYAVAEASVKQTACCTFIESLLLHRCEAGPPVVKSGMASCHRRLHMIDAGVLIMFSSYNESMMKIADGKWRLGDVTRAIEFEG